LKKLKLSRTAANLYLAPNPGQIHGILTLQLAIRPAIEDEKAARDLVKGARLYTSVTAETSLEKDLYEFVTVTTINITETNVVATRMSNVLAAVLQHARIETAVGKEKEKEKGKEKEKEKEKEKRSAIEIEIVIVIFIFVNEDMIATLVVTETAVATGNNLTVNEGGHEKRLEIQSVTNPETRNETETKIDIETEIKTECGIEIKTETETEIVIVIVTETGIGIITDPDLGAGARLPN
jgi:hypothetical protein